MISRILLFLILNFGALGIGGFFTGKGVSSDWYAQLEKAPWTPPGWTFGLAWTFIMICFTFYMAYVWPMVENKKLLIGLFSVQWLLNVMWNPVFFYYQNVAMGLFVILTLTLLVGFLLVHYYPILKVKSLFILPYFIWLCIASSLNAYIFLFNG